MTNTQTLLGRLDGRVMYVSAILDCSELDRMPGRIIRVEEPDAISYGWGEQIPIDCAAGWISEDA